jgi:uncharacterized Zn-binding protein involved in type VI secretion
MVTPGTPPIPHIGGPVVGPGSSTVMIEGLPAARVSDMALCTAPVPDVIATGSMSVMVNGLPLARVGDMTVHGGVILVGASTVQAGG